MQDERARHTHPQHPKGKAQGAHHKTDERGHPAHEPRPERRLPGPQLVRGPARVGRDSLPLQRRSQGRRLACPGDQGHEGIVEDNGPGVPKGPCHRPEDQGNHVHEVGLGGLPAGVAAGKRGHPDEQGHAHRTDDGQEVPQLLHEPDDPRGREEQQVHRDQGNREDEALEHRRAEARGQREAPENLGERSLDRLGIAGGRLPEGSPEGLHVAGEGSVVQGRNRRLVRGGARGGCRGRRGRVEQAG